MTLEGGGGGGVLGGIGDAIGGAFEGIGDAIGGAAEGIGDFIGGAAEGVGDAFAGIDDFVGDVIPGGWGTVAAIAVPYAAPYLMGAALTAGQAAALAAGTSAATGAIQGKPLDQIALNAALAGGMSYGLNSLGGESIDLDTPYVDLPDGETLLTPDSVYVPDEAAGPYIDGTPPPPRDFDYISDEAVRDFDTTDILPSDVPSRDFDTTETTKSANFESSNILDKKVLSKSTG
jgi:hypothetical protein